MLQQIIFKKASKYNWNYADESICQIIKRLIFFIWDKETLNAIFPPDSDTWTLPIC